MLERKITIPKMKIRRWDWLLVIGLVLAPMTGLRIWKVGPAEVLVFLWCLKYIPKKKIHNSGILRFFGVFLGSMAIGTIWGLVVAREEVILSGWITWAYLAFVSIGIYTGLSLNSAEYTERLISTFVFVAALWNIPLYLYASAGGRSILGAPLWYYYRYSGGGTNPHQIAVLMCGMVFLSLKEVLERRRLLLNLGITAFGILILLRTESSTAVLSLAMGIVIEFFVVINRRIPGRARRFRFLLLEVVIALLVLVVFYRLIYRFAYNWIASDSNGLGRLSLAAQFERSFKASPIFGLGPGSHARRGTGELIEYHNTYLEILAATGIVGMVAFLRFTFLLLQKIKEDTLYLPMVVAMYGYGFAGFAMRRLIYWGLIVLVYVVCERKQKERYIRTEGLP